MKKYVKKIIVLFLIIMILFPLEIFAVENESENKKFSDKNFFYLPDAVTSNEYGFSLDNYVENVKASYYQWIPISKEVDEEMLKIEEEWLKYIGTRGELFKKEGRAIKDEAFYKDVEKREPFEKGREELTPKYNDNAWIKTLNNYYLEIINFDMDKYPGTERFVLWVKVEKENGEIGYNKKIYRFNAETQSLFDPISDYMELKPLTLKKGDVIDLKEIVAFANHPIEWFDFQVRNYLDFHKAVDNIDNMSYHKEIPTSNVEIKDGKLFAKNIGLAVIVATNRNSSRKIAEKTFIRIVPENNSSSIIEDTNISKENETINNLNQSTEITEKLTEEGFLKTERIVIIAMSVALLILLIYIIILKKKEKDFAKSNN